MYSYYEFVGNTSLTDEEWQKMPAEDKQPASPEWTGSFTDWKGKKGEIPAPPQ